MHVFTFLNRHMSIADEGADGSCGQVRSYGGGESVELMDSRIVLSVIIRVDGLW